jgi:hypothetical protein
MSSENFLFNHGIAITPDEIRKIIDKFAYKETTHEIIIKSKELNKDGEVFVNYTARILSNFKMTRSGPFKGKDITSSKDSNAEKFCLNVGMRLEMI